jgi:carbon-monoxide dehydrogenase medium subunit
VTPFALDEPRTLREAAGLLDPNDVSVRPIAGGTALMLMMKAGMFRPTRLVSLRRVEDRHRRIELSPDGTLLVGALAPLAALERSAEARRAVPVIGETLRTLSNVRIRNVATVGGHLAHADPHMDLPPVLMTLGARVAVIDPSGERTIAVEDLCVGYYETVLAPNELIAELSVPAQGARRAAYLKCTANSADDWPALGVAVSLDGNATRVAVCAATERPIRLPAVESVLRGTIDDATLRRAGEAAADTADIVADTRGSAPYKRQLLRVTVERAVRAAATRGTR